jgi:hypothetical protein
MAISVLDFIAPIIAVVTGCTISGSMRRLMQAGRPVACAQRMAGPMSS